MADYRTNLTSEVIDEVKRFFKEKVFKTIIPRSIKLSEAPGFGKPIHLYDKNSIGARTYLALANEMLGEAISDDINQVSMQQTEFV
jgi:chromosome partitioning protein